MHPKRQQRLFLVIFIVLLSGIAVGLVTYALRSNIDLFYPPTKLVSGEAPVDVRIRAGGCVVPGSITSLGESLARSFEITDGAAVVEVQYEGILPDLFEEGEAAVVTGKLSGDGIFMATQVLAKHDETYMPPEVADTMVGDGVEHQKTCEGVGGYKK